MLLIAIDIGQGIYQKNQTTAREESIKNYSIAHHKNLHRYLTKKFDQYESSWSTNTIICWEESKSSYLKHQKIIENPLKMN